MSVVVQVTKHVSVTYHNANEWCTDAGVLHVRHRVPHRRGDRILLIVSYAAGTWKNVRYEAL